METITMCPACGSSVVEREYNFKIGEEVSELAKSHLPENGFDFYLCECGAAYLSPRMSTEEQYEYYSSGTYREQIAEKVTDAREITLQKARANIVNYQIKDFKYKSHLDVGCSTGELLRKVAEGKGKGFKSIGVDPDPKWPGGVKILYRMIEEVKGKFDLITLIEVLEHLNKPQDMIEKIKERLTPGGLLVIEVPNRKCYMTAYDAPKHVVAYDILSLGKLVSKLGLEVIGYALHDHIHDGPLDMYITILATNDAELCQKRYGKK